MKLVTRITLSLWVAILGFPSLTIGQTNPANPANPADSAEDPQGISEKKEEPANPNDAAAETFLIKCAGCHTVGRGKLTGPDLLPSTGWPEADLAVGIRRMEPKTGPLTDEEVTVLVTLLKDSALDRRLSAQESIIAQRFAAKLDAPNLELGRALFVGEEPFSRGGAPCSACHVAAGYGGNLGPELTYAFHKLGKIGLISACENTSFPVMRTVYADHPVTKQEAMHLASYLESLADLDPTAPRAPAISAWALALAILTLGTVVLQYRNPRRGVRSRLVRSSYGGHQ